MASVTFITGNQAKADYLAKYLDFPVAHHKLDLEEIQSLELAKIVDHKVRQAYGLLKSPVIVEDVSLEFTAFGQLPGPFIKFFIEQVPLETICRMLPDGMDRSATARCVFGYYDGQELKLFEGSMRGHISKQPAGDGGYGWDKIFIPDGYETTRASLPEEDDRKTYLQIKPFAPLKEYLMQKLV